MSYKNVECTIIENATEGPFGVFCNAIRLSLDGAEVLIDFCLYSEAENRARVVSRVRVSKDFLPIIGQRIGDSYRPQEKSTLLYMMPPVTE